MSSKRELDDWLTSYLEWTEESEPSYMYRLWSGISAIAAVLERKCYVSWGSLTFYPNMYIVLVGPPAARKGTAMRQATSLLRKVPGVKIAPDAVTREALIRRIKEAVDTIVHEDGTMQFHCSMTINSEEFAVFLGYDNKDLIANLCDWFDCKDTWTYDTKHQGKDEITGLWVNLIGATTPHLIRTTLPIDSIGGGLTSRIVFVYEEKRGKLCVYPYSDEKQQRKLINDLEKIYLLKGQFRADDSFMEYWTEWYTREFNNPPMLGPEFDHYIDRRPTHVMKLSMVMAASRSDNPDMVVSRRDMERAVQLLEATEEKMPLTFKGYGRSNIVDLMERVMTVLFEEKEIPLPSLMEHFYRDADKFTMQRVLDTLESMQKAKVVVTGSGPPLVVSLHSKIERSKKEPTDG